MSDEATTPDEVDTITPTSVRLTGTQVSALERIHKVTTLAKGKLISLAVNALIDHVERTGKLPLPQARRNKTSETVG